MVFPRGMMLPPPPYRATPVADQRPVLPMQNPMMGVPPGRNVRQPTEPLRQPRDMEWYYDQPPEALRSMAANGDTMAAQALKEWEEYNAEIEGKWQNLQFTPRMNVGSAKETAQYGAGLLRSGTPPEEIQQRTEGLWPHQSSHSMAQGSPIGPWSDPTAVYASQLGAPPGAPTSPRPPVAPRPAGMTPTGAAPGGVSQPAAAPSVSMAGQAPTVDLQPTPVAQGPDKWQNLLNFGLNLMAASEPRPGSVVGPSALGAIGQAGLATQANIRQEKAAASKSAHQRDIFNVERKKLEMQAYKITQDAETKRLLHKINQDNESLDRKLELMKIRSDIMAQLAETRTKYAELITQTSYAPFENEGDRQAEIMRLTQERDAQVRAMLERAGVQIPEDPLSGAFDPMELLR